MFQIQTFLTFQDITSIITLQVLYFELGGFEKRAMFWNLWCEKVKFLCPVDPGSSHSETSVATSSTGSTLYLLDRKFVSFNGIKQLWCKFGSTALLGEPKINDTDERTLVRKWTDKYLYLGRDFDMNVSNQSILVETEEDPKNINPKKSIKLNFKKHYHESYMNERGLNFGDSVKVLNFVTFCEIPY